MKAAVVVLEGKNGGNNIENYFTSFEFKMRHIFNIRQNSYQVPLFSILATVSMLYFLILMLYIII